MSDFHGKRVSRSWKVVLDAAQADGVRFKLNDGRRTMAEQAERRAIYERDGWPVAAVPAPTAPHIALGLESHALDVEWTDGGVYRLAAWLRAHGCEVAWTVPGEKWHIQVAEEDLLRLARELRDPLAAYPTEERRWIRELDDLARRHRDTNRQAVLRRRMTARRKSIWRAAQPKAQGGDGHGWGHLNRAARYKSLQARTR